MLPRSLDVGPSDFLLRGIGRHAKLREQRRESIDDAMLAMLANSESSDGVDSAMSCFSAPCLVVVEGVCLMQVPARDCCTTPIPGGRPHVWVACDRSVRLSRSARAHLEAVAGGPAEARSPKSFWAPSHPRVPLRPPPEVSKPATRIRSHHTVRCKNRTL